MDFNFLDHTAQALARSVIIVLPRQQNPVVLLYHQMDNIIIISNKPTPLIN